VAFIMNEIAPFKIRDIEINPPLVLSPMAGVTDISFRRLLKQRGGIGLTVSEFISVEGLTRNNPKSKRQMRFYENERPFAVQIFGAQPARMRMAAEMAEEVGADILDVNCGCPAPKVVKHGGGSGLLKDHPRLEEILTEIKKAITIPMTVKIRAGFYDHTINAIETAKLAEACGAQHIALHGRTAVVESIERDYEDVVHVAVLVDDDPGKDLGALRQPGHRFFFGLDDLERVEPAEELL